MGAAKGNKHAVGNNGGRPIEYDRAEWAQKLLNWASLETSTNLNGFCCLNDIEPSRIIHWAKESDVFKQAYEKAKSYLATRREERLSAGTLHVKAYDLNASVYDQFRKDEQRALLEYESGLKTKESEVEALNLAKIAKSFQDGSVSQK